MLFLLMLLLLMDVAVAAAADVVVDIAVVQRLCDHCVRHGL